MKMNTINKSFLWGIVFASITWLISIYLYMQLSKTTGGSLSQPRRMEPVMIQHENNYFNNDLNNIISNEISGTYRKKFFDGAKDSDMRNLKKYYNSAKLIKSLQPVLPSSKSIIDKDLDELGMVKTLEDQRIRDEGYKLYAFNALVSTSLSPIRDIPDTRNKLCKSQKYASKLPQTSIIICFYNEQYDTLIRSISSVIHRTPAEFMFEIILVDDFSDVEGLSSKVTDYIGTSGNKKIKYFNTEKREGLIRARMFGAKQATGEVIVFLDSHIEVNIQWLEPLLTRITESPNTVSIPIIDIINPDTFAYSASPLVRGGFNWGLHFKWENLPTGTLVNDEDFIKPIKTPTMAGGLFAMNRQYFTELGEYDSGMDIWGGENLELSFRVWMCGGDLELIPCSRVGHVFRKRRPYGSPSGEDTMLRNSLRVAHVWLDEYKDYFIKQRPESRNVSYGDVRSRQKLRADLKCKSFSWYLKNVYPELILPSDDEARLKKKWGALEQNKYQPWHSRKRNYQGQYLIRLANSSLCMQSSKDEKTKGAAVVLAPCLRTKKQMWYETDRNELVLAQLLCLDAGQPNVRLSKCHEMGGTQEWKHKGENGSPIYSMAAGTCLGVKKKEVGAEVIMNFCVNLDLSQWDLVM